MINYVFKILSKRNNKLYSMFNHDGIEYNFEVEYYSDIFVRASVGELFSFDTYKNAYNYLQEKINQSVSWGVGSGDWGLFLAEASLDLRRIDWVASFDSAITAFWNHEISGSHSVMETPIGTMCSKEIKIIAECVKWGYGNEHRWARSVSYPCP